MRGDGVKEDRAEEGGGAGRVQKRGGGEGEYGGREEDEPHMSASLLPEIPEPDLVV